MIANIQNYRPQTIEFNLDESVKEKFPLTLFDGAEDINEIIEEINKHFTATFPERETAVRLMDDYEIQQIREEYCLKTENDLPNYKMKLLEAIEHAKNIKREAEEALQACMTSISELAAKSKDGIADYNLSSTNTVRFALCGHYLFYTWEDGKFKLAKCEKIPDWDARELWAQDDNNRNAMKELFGIEFPEVEKPGNDADNLPWEEDDNDCDDDDENDD